MAFIRCVACSRHVRSSAPSCPFCSAKVLSKPRARGKNGIAIAAGVAAMGVGLGCAYGMPADDYDRDASSRDASKPDVGVLDGSRDAPVDAPSVDASPDAKEGGATDAALDAQDGGG